MPISIFKDSDFLGWSPGICIIYSRSFMSVNVVSAQLKTASGGGMQMTFREIQILSQKRLNLKLDKTSL